MALAVRVLDHPIAKYRDARGMSLRTLASATKIHYVRLHHAEHGRPLSPAELARVARALGVDVATLQPSSHDEGVTETDVCRALAS